MGLQKRTRALSKITKALLLAGESERADFKRAPDGVSADDLVSFANTEAGGNILIGIEEIADPAGAQRGQVVGCDIGDQTILQILNKATNCIPPLAVEIHIENLSAKPILRIEVPSSENRPHCTPKGVYCRRDGSRIRALHPPELLKIFLDKEAGAFASRFESAAQNISKSISALDFSLTATVNSIKNTLGSTESLLDDTESTLGTILAFAKKIDGEVQDASTRLRTIFRQDNREDPIRARTEKALLDRVVEQLSKDSKLFKAAASGQRLSVNLSGHEAAEFGKDDLTKILGEAITAIEKKNELAKYAISVKPAQKCTEEELDRFAELVLMGGEVGAGVRQRLDSAAALGFITYQELIVGTAALKNPSPIYSKKVFKLAQSSSDPSNFPLELGWIYLEPNHRHKGQMHALANALIDSSKNKGVYATARAENMNMKSILGKYDFVRDGVDYDSLQSPGEKLELYVRKPNIGKKA